MKYNLRSLMMRNPLAIFTWVAIFSLAIVGCSSQSSSPQTLPEFPKTPTSLTLYAVDFRDEEYPNEPKNDGKERLGKYLVLGKVEIRDSAKREAIMAAIKKAIREPAEPTKCFEPRHGLKVVDEKGVTEIVICFHCFQFISTGAHRSEGYEVISASPQESLNRILKEAGIDVVPDNVRL